MNGIPNKINIGFDIDDQYAITCANQPSLITDRIIINDLKMILSSLFIKSQLNIGTIRALCEDNNINTYINFDDILHYQKIDMSFIHDYYDKINLNVLFKYQQIPLSFIDKNINSFNTSVLSIISKYQKLSLDFVEKHIALFNYSDLFNNSNIRFNIDFFSKHIEDFNSFDYQNIICISNLDEVINDIIRLIEPYNYKQLNWKYISYNCILDEDTIFKCLNYLDFNSPLLCDRTFKDDNIYCYRLLKYNF